MRLGLRAAALLPVYLVWLAACDPTALVTPGGASLRPVPDAVRTLAAPDQNIDTARVLPEDGCYWYEHAGPVETTLLPLRTAEGRMICPVQTADATETTAG